MTVIVPVEVIEAFLVAVVIITVTWLIVARRGE